MSPGTDIGPLLLKRARHAIGRHLCLDAPASVAHDRRLLQKGATFVTLTRDGALRGCIGSIRAQRPLGEDVDRNAVAAASEDPRFPIIAADEFEDIRIEVSLLSAPEYLEGVSEEELLVRLRPGHDGVILFAGCRSATFLPQVWDHLPEPASFLSALKQKAGLEPDRPSASLMFATYSVRKWRE